MTNEQLLQRITVNPDVMVGKPVIRGTRIPVAMILRMLGQGIPPEEILREYPRLEGLDVDAAVAYAARVVELEDVFPITLEEKEMLFEIAYRRFIEQRRMRLAEEVAEAREAYQLGQVRRGTVDELLAELAT